MSLRDIIKRYLPPQHTYHEHKHLRLFGDLLHDHNIWRLTRRSVAGGVGAGIFCAMVPIIGQMILAGAIAIYFRVNLPLAAAFTWVSNPFTFAPLIYIAYKIGSKLLNIPMQYKEFHLSYTWISGVIHDIWLPVFAGGLIIGTLGAVVGYYTISLLWRLLLLRKRDELRSNGWRRKAENSK